MGATRVTAMTSLLFPIALSLSLSLSFSLRLALYRPLAAGVLRVRVQRSGEGPAAVVRFLRGRGRRLRSSCAFWRKRLL